MGPLPEKRQKSYISEIIKILKDSKSLTGKYLSGKMKIEYRGKKVCRKNTKYIRIKGARENNLKEIDVKIPAWNVCMYQRLAVQENQHL